MPKALFAITPRSQFWSAALLLCASTSAQSGAGFLDALREAALTNPATRSATRSLEAADQEQQAARWQRFPSPSFQSQTGQDGERSSRLALEQPLYTGGRIEASIEAADHRQQASEHQRQQVAQDVAIRLANTWYEWQRQGERLAAQQDGVSAHRQLRDQIARRAHEGVSTQVDLALAAARLSQVQAELAQSQAAHGAARAQLQQLAGEHLAMLMAAGQALQAQGPAALPLPAPNWPERALQRDPQLARLDAEALAAGADIRVRRAQLMPTVSLVLDRYMSGPQQNQGHRTWLQVSAQPGAGLTSLASVNAAAARKEAAEENRHNASLELEQVMVTDLASHAAAREQMGVASLLRQSTQDVADSYARQFVAGRKSWLEVLNAVREAMQARLSVIDANALLGQTAWRLHLRALGLNPTPTPLPGGAS